MQTHQPEPAQNITLRIGSGDIKVSEISTSKSKIASLVSAGLNLTLNKLEIEPPEQYTEEQMRALIAGEYEQVSRQITEAKAKVAFRINGNPIFVEDTSLVLIAAPHLTGPLIKLWCQKDREGNEVWLEALAKLAKGLGDQRAIAYSTLAVSDGTNAVSFIGQIEGTIADKPRGESGFGWDSVFAPIPDQQNNLIGTENPLTNSEILDKDPELLARYFSFRRQAIKELIAAGI